MFTNKYILKSISIGMLTILLLELAAPMAMTAGGSSQPEFTANAGSNSEMVDPFTGQFHYSLPLIDVPGAHGAGYSVSLNYTAGNSPDAEASWVGYGWSLNTGSITRGKRGFADDIYNEKVTYYNKTRPITTFAVGATKGAEVADFKALGLGSGEYIRYNSVMGFSIASGYWASALGIANVGLNIDSQDGPTASYSVDIRPSSLLGILKKYTGFSPNYFAYYNPSLLTIKGQIGGTEPPQSINMKPITSNGFTANLSLLRSSILLAGLDNGLYGMAHIIKGQENKERYAYGYMYSAAVTSNNTEYKVDGAKYSLDGDKDYVKEENIKALMDYSTEGEAPFDVKKTTRLYAPFGNSDNFIVSAQGLGGTFRVHNKGTVQYRQAAFENQTKFTNVTLQGVLPNKDKPPKFGKTYGLSGSFDPALTKMSIGKSDYFEPNGNDYNYITGKWYSDRIKYKEKPWFFRFRNDMGGKVLNSTKDNPVNLPRGGGAIDSAYYYHEVNRGRTQGSASFVSYNTFKDLPAATSSTFPGRRYSYGHSNVFGDNGATTNEERKRRKTLINNEIGEYSVVNSNGNRYTFGQPVFARNEVTISYDATPDPAERSKTSIINKNVKPENLKNTAVAIGEQHTDPYVTSHLLTEITTPDYVDRTNDGPTKDDFGGWVKFNYTPVHGGTNNKYGTDAWFKWRSPQYGLHYSMGPLSRPEDDMGTVSYGEREIYVLESIETATHIAKFTVDINGRFDGQGAGITDENLFANNFPVSASITTGLPSPMLQHIDLYVFQPDGTLTTGQKPLKSVYFAYDYSAWPKSWDNSHMSSTDNNGKLTLKKVWFESMGVKNASIAPYQFFYKYQLRHTEISNYYGSGCTINAYINNSTVSGLSEEPEYKPSNIDRWGCYRDATGSNIPFQTHPWVDQSHSSTFDPATWQLKMIKLPSGGEIHVEYEQNEYQYVQDRRAMKMMKVSALGENVHIVDIKDEELFGEYTPSDGLRTLMINQIQKQFVDGKERIYFKYLFNLLGPACDMREYLDGYARVQSVAAHIIGTGTTINGIRIILGDGTYKSSPGQAAKDYRQAMNIGLLNYPQCIGSVLSSKPDMNDPQAGFKSLLSFLYSGGVSFLNSVSAFASPEIASSSLTDGYNNASYLRLPLVVPKKGGGIRVRRIITVSPKDLLGDERSKVTGVEYLYETTDENNHFISSGVATNEPKAGGEENALVRITEENIPEFGEYDIIAGVNTQYYEGPLGMQLLPAPTIGYSRIIARNICSNANTPGFQVLDYYTAKEIPTLRTEKNTMETPLLPPEGPEVSSGDYLEESIAVEQGYAFDIASMHGTFKAMFTYGGEYVPGLVPSAPNTSDAEQFSVPSSTSTEYEYFLNDKKGVASEVPVMYDIDKPLRMEPLGKEMETFFETRGIREEIENEPTHATVALNLNKGFFIPLASLWFYEKYKLDKIDILVTNKIINRPAFLKSVKTTTADGIVHLSENIAFDPSTGAPAITRTSDSYNNVSGNKGFYTTYTTPACNVYNVLNQKTNSEGLTFVPQKTFRQIVNNFTSAGTTGSIGFFSNSFYTPSTDPLAMASFANYKGVMKELAKIFTVNDIIEIRSGVDNKYKFTAKITGITLNTDDGLSTCAFDILDVPVPTTAISEPNVIIEILRSGKTNQLNADAEKVTVYGDSKAEATVADAKRLAEYEKKAEEFNDWMQVQSYANPKAQGIGLEKDRLAMSYNPFGSYSSCATSKAVNIRNHSLNNEYDYIDYFWSYCEGGGPVDHQCYPPAPIAADPLHVPPIVADPGPGPGLNGRWLEIGARPVNSADPRIMRLGLTTSRQPSGYDKWAFSSSWIIDPMVVDPLGMPYNVDEVHQDFPYSGLGQELFHINDDGELVMYHYVNEQTSVRNVAFVFRQNFESSNRFKYVAANTPCNSCFPASLPTVRDHIGCQTYEKAFPYSIRNSVITASAQAYSNKRPKVGFIYDAETSTTTAVAGRLTSILDGTSNPPVYTTGIAPGTYTRFNFTGSSSSALVTANPSWKIGNDITTYSNSGEPIVTKDDLGVESTALYSSGFAANPDYARTLPSISAWNANNNDVYFESFENHILTTAASTKDAHTGDYFIDVATSTLYSLNPSFAFPGTGAKRSLIQFWFAYENNSVEDTDIPEVKVGGTTLTPTSIIRTGRWRLFTTETGTAPSGGSAVTIKNQSTVTKMHLDDIKIQPYESKATCTVIDRNLRPRAVFGDNHLAMIIQYDGRGVPVRKIAETERGYFTITDDHTNVPLIDRGTVTSGLVTSMVQSGESGRAAPNKMMLKKAKEARPNYKSWVPEPIPGNEPGEWNSDFDVLQLNLSPEKQNFKIFGIDSVNKIFDKERLKEKYKIPGQLPSVDSVDIKKKINGLKQNPMLKKTSDSIENVRTNFYQNMKRK